MRWPWTRKRDLDALIATQEEQFKRIDEDTEDLNERLRVLEETHGITRAAVRPIAKRSVKAAR